MITLEEANKVFIGKRLEQDCVDGDWMDLGVITGISRKGDSVLVYVDKWLSDTTVHSEVVTLFSWDTVEELVSGGIPLESLSCPVLEQDDMFRYRLKV